MTATNHAITGAIIALSIKNPAIALPLALASHFVQDMVPHFGYAGHGGYEVALKNRLQKLVMLADPLAFILLAFILLSHHVSFWVWAAAFLALAPDFHDFIAYFVFKKPKLFNRFSRFASRLQWCERPWGIWVEIVWYVAGLILLKKLLS